MDALETQDKRTHLSAMDIAFDGDAGAQYIDLWKEIQKVKHEISDQLGFYSGIFRSNFKIGSRDGISVWSDFADLRCRTDRLEDKVDKILSILEDRFVRAGGKD